MTVVAFDFDGTLSDSEMTVLLGERRSVADEMAEITDRAMNDEIGYATSLRERAALLEGLSEADATAAFDQVELRPGAADLIETLNEAGVTTAILTGGFERGVAAALEREGVTVDHIVSNRLPITEAELTGEVDGPLIEGTKDDALAELAESVGVSLADTVAVGDGANDLPMLEAASLAIGFEPKPAVEPHCDVVVSSMAAVEETLVSEGVLDRS
ncbi:phosphoserine phosphatase SerB [Natrialba asiatica]|uniref:phosphoserine phosphatase n=1 Tax=Natrialba asiatica (strain ATCC 700177 / DSM 12278 / JCM 9576 / FERM P-10747 / NBRC 102637 / 172P1) TaxID=29540 RepID=M0AKM7_NATA1|nr:phosphoserine phosphatase SerB [Natrialba asiatica]ELY97933.1 phosphoserine phosphatase SerB [Natrialba asiatica DSM 12278]